MLCAAEGEVLLTCGWQAGGERCGGANPRASGRAPPGSREIRALAQRSLGRAAGTKSGGDWLCLSSRCQGEPRRARLLFALEDAFLAPSVQYVAVTLMTTP